MNIQPFSRMRHPLNTETVEALRPVFGRQLGAVFAVYDQDND
jgi:hypothetical protein